MSTFVIPFGNDGVGSAERLVFLAPNLKIFEKTELGKYKQVPRKI